MSDPRDAYLLSTVMYASLERAGVHVEAVQNASDAKGDVEILIDPVLRLVLSNKAPDAFIRSQRDLLDPVRSASVHNGIVMPCTNPELCSAVRRLEEEEDEDDDNDQLNSTTTAAKSFKSSAYSLYQSFWSGATAATRNGDVVTRFATLHTRLGDDEDTSRVGCGGDSHSLSEHELATLVKVALVWAKRTAQPKERVRLYVTHTLQVAPCLDEVMTSAVQQVARQGSQFPISYSRQSHLEQTNTEMWSDQATTMTAKSSGTCHVLETSTEPDLRLCTLIDDGDAGGDQSHSLCEIAAAVRTLGIKQDGNGNNSTTMRAHAPRRARGRGRGRGRGRAQATPQPSQPPQPMSRAQRAQQRSASTSARVDAIRLRQAIEAIAAADERVQIAPVEQEQAPQEEDVLNVAEQEQEQEQDQDQDQDVQQAAQPRAAAERRSRARPDVHAFRYAVVEEVTGNNELYGSTYATFINALVSLVSDNDVAPLPQEQRTRLDQQAKTLRDQYTRDNAITLPKSHYNRVLSTFGWCGKGSAPGDKFSLEAHECFQNGLRKGMSLRRGN
jgi:hypothetical protein